MPADRNSHEDESAVGRGLSLVAWQTAVLGALGLTVASVVALNAAVCSSLSGWLLLVALIAPLSLLVALVGWLQIELRQHYRRLALTGVIVIAVLYLPYFFYVFVGSGMASASC